MVAGRDTAKNDRVARAGRCSHQLPTVPLRSLTTGDLNIEVVGAGDKVANAQGGNVGGVEKMFGTGRLH